MTLDYRVLFIFMTAIGVWFTFGLLLGRYAVYKDPISVVWRVYGFLAVVITAIVIVSYWLYGWQFG